MLLLPHEPPDAPGFNIEIPPESGHLLGHPYAYSSAGQPARDAHYYTASLVHTGLHVVVKRAPDRRSVDKKRMKDSFLRSEKMHFVPRRVANMRTATKGRF